MTDDQMQSAFKAARFTFDMLGTDAKEVVLHISAIEKMSIRFKKIEDEVVCVQALFL